MESSKADLEWTYAAYDILVVRQVSFAVLAAIDLMAVQIDIICETHDFPLCE